MTKEQIALQLQALMKHPGMPPFNAMDLACHLISAISQHADTVPDVLAGDVLLVAASLARHEMHSVCSQIEADYLIASLRQGGRSS